MINKCEKLKMVSTYTLAYGNYMNGQSPRGANFGFGLSDLMIAFGIASQDGSTNLLAYILSRVEKDHPSLNYEDLTSEMALAEFAKNNEIESLKKPIADVKASAECLKEAIQT